MNADKATTVTGLVGGIALVLGNVYPQYKAIADAVSALALAFVSYFVAKS